MAPNERFGLVESLEGIRMLRDLMSHRIHSAVGRIL